MKIPATELKQTLKKLSPVRCDFFQIGPHGISAQDSDVWVVVESPLSELGSFTVVGKKLTQVANRMSGVIDITATETDITLRSAKAEIKLEIKAKKPPALPPIPSKAVGLNASDFKQAVGTAVSSASPNKSAGFGGVVQVQSLALGLEEDSPAGYRVVGTDSKVLTVATKTGPLPHEISSLLNLTAAGVVQIMETETITYGESDTGVYLKSGPVTVYASRPNQVFPNVDPLLNAAVATTVKFKPEEWLAAFRTIEPIIEEQDGENKTALHFSEGVVGFSSSGTGSEAKDEAGYEQLDPDPLLEPREFTLVMIAEHLSGFLAKASGEATLSFSEISHPLKLECGGVQVLTFARKGSKK